MDKQQRNLQKIDRVFEVARKQGVVVSEKKGRLSDRTYETYQNVVKGYANYLHREHGIDDIARAKPRHAYQYLDKQIRAFKENGEGSVFSMRRFPHAINFFRVASKQTGVFKGEVRLGDQRQMLQTITDNKLFRKAADSQTMKASSEISQRVRTEILNSRSINKETIANITRVQEMAGGRISATLRLQPQHIDLGRNTITFLNDKGGLTRMVHFSEKDKSFIASLIAGRKPTDPIFHLRGRDGQDMSVKEGRLYVAGVIDRAAERAGVNGEKKFSSHSFRKTFANERYQTYRQWSHNQLKQEIARRIKDEPRLKDKYDTIRMQINAKIKEENRGRDLSPDEKSRFLASHDIGHARLDVMRFYIER